MRCARAAGPAAVATALTAADVGLRARTGRCGRKSLASRSAAGCWRTYTSAWLGAGRSAARVREALRVVSLTRAG